MQSYYYVTQVSFTFLSHQNISPSFPMSLSSQKILGSESCRTCHTLNMLQSHFLNLILWPAMISRGVSFDIVDTLHCLIWGSWCMYHLFPHHPTPLLDPLITPSNRFPLQEVPNGFPRRAEKESSVSTIQRNRSLGLCRCSAGKEHKLIVSGKQTAISTCVLEEEAPITNTCRGLVEAQQQSCHISS